MNEQEKAIPKITDAEKGATRLPVSSVIPEGTAYQPGSGKHGAKRPLDDKLIPYEAALRFEEGLASTSSGENRPSGKMRRTVLELIEP